MNIINKTVYVAFDGTEFTDKNECRTYEKKKLGFTPNLRSFPVTFPMQDDDTSCVVYWIPCENAFNILKEHLEDEFPETDIDKYQGDGWYVVQYWPGPYAYVTKLSMIMNDWSRTMNTIAKHTMDFEGV